jgi:hypothetical protein
MSINTRAAQFALAKLRRWIEVSKEWRPTVLGWIGSDSSELEKRFGDRLHNWQEWRSAKGGTDGDAGVQVLA